MKWSNNATLNLPVCVRNGAQRSPKVARDAAGNYFIIWLDELWKNANQLIVRVCVQRLDAQGNACWSADGVPVTPAAEIIAENIDIEYDGQGGAYVVWLCKKIDLNGDGTVEDLGHYQLFIQYIDANGQPKWDPPLPVNSLLYHQSTPAVTNDGQGGIIVCWISDAQNPDYPSKSPKPVITSVFAQKMHQQVPCLRWGNSGMLVFQPSGQSAAGSVSPGFIRAISDSAGGVFLAFDFGIAGQDYIEVVRIKTDGSRHNGLSCDEGTRMGNGYYGLGYAVAVASGDGGAIFIWQKKDYSGTKDLILAQKVDSDCNPVWDQLGALTVCDEQGNRGGSGSTRGLDADTDSVGGVIIAWEDERIAPAHPTVYVQRVDASGTASWSLNGIPVSNGGGTNQYEPRVSSDSNGGAIVSWARLMAVGGWDLSAQRLDSNGTKLWPYEIDITDALNNQSKHETVGDGYGGVVAVWEDCRNLVASQEDIYAQYLFLDGKLGLPQRQLTIGVLGQGDTSPAEGPHTYDMAEVVNIDVQPAKGWAFFRWAGDVTEIEDVWKGSTSITMHKDHSITAVFVHWPKYLLWYWPTKWWRLKKRPFS